MSRTVSASEQMSVCLDDEVMVSVVDVLPDISLQKGLSFFEVCGSRRL
jgi:hypothetical protein